MKFYNATQLLYLETDASGIGLRGTLLQDRSSTSCPRDKATDKSILRPIAFVRRANQVYKEDTAALKERHLIYFMGSRSSITAAF